MISQISPPPHNLVPSSFLSRITTQDPQSRSWLGFTESRVLGFLRFLEYLPLRHPLHFFPAVSKTDKSPNSLCYFIGFDVDKVALEAGADRNIHVDECAYKFT